jgi:glutathione S-transferase
MTNAKPHLLYNYRRCPYVMRTRMALVRGHVPFVCEDIVFYDKPQAMLDASPKGTVPVLILNDGTVLDESIDIIKWALPNEWADVDHDLIAANDGWFKAALDAYKYPDKFPDVDRAESREKGLEFISRLDDIVKIDNLTLTDMCIFPFIRQFRGVDREWFDAMPYENTKNWLNWCTNSALFQTIFDKKFKVFGPSDVT